MKRTLKVLAIAALLPTSALAAITNSKHDLSSSNVTNSYRSNNAMNQICVFCHTPHGAQATQLLWNHTATSPTPTYSWGVPNTTAGTTLPTAGFSVLTRRCLSCHDGTVGLGSVTNLPNGYASITMTINTIGAGPTQIGNAGNMAGHHPLGIPYPGATKGSVTYNGATNQAVVGAFDYWGAQVSTACTTPTGACTLATGGSTNGLNVTLYGNGGAAATLTNVGIECASCHDVHNEYGNAAFMRVVNTGSGLCLSCHRK